MTIRAKIGKPKIQDTIGITMDSGETTNREFLFKRIHSFVVSFINNSLKGDGWGGEKEET